jgi:phosphoesterase RecJ-like protein
VKANASFPEIAEVLRSRQRFVVMSHMRPDGDALGCSIAMGLALKGLGKDVTVWNQDGVPEKFRFMPGSEMVEVPPAAGETRDFEVAVVLDNAVQNRVGRSLGAVGRAEIWINMDHHISNDRYGDLAYVDSSAPAAGQILFEFFREQGFEVTREMADNLYVAISTDTGSFQYPSTTARTYELAAQLVALGVNVGDLAQKMYESYPRRRLELLREVLNSLRFSAGGKIASFSLSIATVDRIGAKAEDNEGLIDYIRAVDGVVAAAFFEELPEGKVRISLRSKDARVVDVCKVCAKFGGGGHVLAAGARAAGTLAEVEERVIAAIAGEVGEG